MFSDVLPFQYDVLAEGESGGGGEYEAQTGFGWTNGVVFELLNQLNESTIHLNENTTNDQENTNNCTSKLFLSLSLSLLYIYINIMSSLYE